MVSSLMRAGVVVLSFATLTLGLSGSPAQAQCKGGQGKGGSQSSQQSQGGAQQSSARSQSGGSQQAVMQQLAAVQQQQLLMVQTARAQQQAALQAALQTTAARIAALQDEADESPRVATRLAWLQQRQAVLQAALGQASSMTNAQRGQR